MHRNKLIHFPADAILLEIDLIRHRILKMISESMQISVKSLNLNIGNQFFIPNCCLSFV